MRELHRASVGADELKRLPNVLTWLAKERSRKFKAGRPRAFSATFNCDGKKADRRRNRPGKPAVAGPNQFTQHGIFERRLGE